MDQAAKFFFDTINSYEDLLQLVDDGESENLFLECKSPVSPTLNSELRATLAKALSAFSNTNGGVIIWGAATTNKNHSGLDIITQIEPIGNCNKFKRQIENKIPTLSTPPIFNTETKIIKKRNSDSRGVVITFIPKRIDDPVQSNEDERFYFRSGDNFVKTPYEMLKRLFTSIISPDLNLTFDSRFVSIDDNDNWVFPIGLENNSTAIAEKIKLFVIIKNIENCETLEFPESFKDVSKLNPQFAKAYTLDFKDFIYKGLNHNLGKIKLKLKGRKRTFLISSTIYADKMLPKKETFKLSLIKGNFNWGKIEN